jgi:hypothetical protein
VKAKYSSKAVYKHTERIVINCKEYKNILLGYHQPIIVFTEHQKNTFNGLKSNASDGFMRWHLLLEEYGVIDNYLPGKKHVGTVEDA